MDGTLYETLKSIKKDLDSPYVFCNINGRPFCNVRRSFETALKKAGITDFRFHDLRHTFASWLVMSGVDLKTVQELLGHKTIEMTMRYSHLSPAHKRVAVQMLDSQLHPKVETKRKQKDCTPS